MPPKGSKRKPAKPTETDATVLPTTKPGKKAKLDVALLEAEVGSEEPITSSTKSAKSAVVKSLEQAASKSARKSPKKRLPVVKATPKKRGAPKKTATAPKNTEEPIVVSEDTSK